MIVSCKERSMEAKKQEEKKISGYKGPQKEFPMRAFC